MLLAGIYVLRYVSPLDMGPLSPLDARFHYYVYIAEVKGHQSDKFLIS